MWAITWDYGTYRPPYTHSSNTHAQRCNGVRCLILVWSFAYAHPPCVQTAKALACVISIIISWAGSYITKKVMSLVLFPNFFFFIKLTLDSTKNKNCFIWKTINEPAHDILALFVFRKFILQTCMRSHPTGLGVWFLAWSYVYFYSSCVRTAKALARLREWAGSPVPSLVAYLISTKISWAGSLIVKCIVLTIIWASFSPGSRNATRPSWWPRQIYLHIRPGWNTTKPGEMVYLLHIFLQRLSLANLLNENVQNQESPC